MPGFFVSQIKEVKMSDDLKNPETIALHAGWRSDASTNSVAVPIHQTTSYQFDNTEPVSYTHLRAHET